MKFLVSINFFVEQITNVYIGCSIFKGFTMHFTVLMHLKPFWALFQFSNHLTTKINFFRTDGNIKARCLAKQQKFCTE